MPSQKGLLCLPAQSRGGDTRRRAISLGELDRAVEGQQPSQSPTKWPPAGYLCECFWPDCQKQTPWWWHQGPTSSSGTCVILRPIVSPYAGAVGPGLLLVQGNECVGSSWMTKALMTSTGPHVPQSWIQLRTSGTLRSGVSAAAEQLTDPGLRSPPGHHPPYHQEHGQTLSGVHTGAWGPFTLLSHMSCGDKIHASWISLWLKFFTLIFSVIFKSSPQWFWFPLTVLMSFCSHRIQQCISFQLEYFVHQDPMCDLSVPLIFWAVYKADL